MSSSREEDLPRVCPRCRLPILSDLTPHRCEQLVCPRCLGALSRGGFCAACLVRYEMPTRDPLDRLAELEASVSSSPEELPALPDAAVEAGARALDAEFLDPSLTMEDDLVPYVKVVLDAACDPALGPDRLVPGAAQLREALEGLAQTARWFSSEADYTVAEVIESEFIEALETAEDLLRGRS